MTARVFVSLYEHRHGSDLAAHGTEAGALARKIAIAAEYWDEEIGAAEPRPADPKNMANRYFEIMAERDRAEFFTVEELEVGR